MAVSTRFAASTQLFALLSGSSDAPIPFSPKCGASGHPLRHQASGQITGRCKLSQPLPMFFSACMETFQSLSDVVILQCILNPVFLGCLLVLGLKGISCRCRGLGGNHSLLLIRHVFAHCRVVGEKHLVAAQSDTNAPATGGSVDQDQFLAAVCSRGRRFGALLRPQLRRPITCPLCPTMISAPQEPVRAKPRTATALMWSARSRVQSSSSLECVQRCLIGAIEGTARFRQGSRKCGP